MALALLEIVIVAVLTVIVSFANALADPEISIVEGQIALALLEIVIVSVPTVIVSFPNALTDLEISIVEGQIPLDWGDFVIVRWISTCSLLTFFLDKKSNKKVKDKQMLRCLSGQRTKTPIG